MAGRALFTSIPKCGKNLVTVLFDALNISRIACPEVQVAAAYVLARWTQCARANGRQLQPGIDHTVLDAYVHEAKAALLTLAERLASLPDGHYIHAHCGFDEGLLKVARAARVPIVFLYRDPRAMMASQAHFLIERGEPADLVSRLYESTLTEAYRLLIDGDGMSLAGDEVFAVYEGWLEASGVLAVRFEDLVGPRGGGSASVQLATVARIAQHVGWRGSTETLVEAAEQIFNPGTGTFRRGTIDGWRNDVPTEVVERHRAYFIDLARRWGYGDGVGTSGNRMWEAAVSGEGSSTLRKLLIRALADGDERLLLVQRLQHQIDEIRVERDRLNADSDARLALVRQLRGKLGEAVAERNRIAADSDERLLLMRAAQAELGAAVAERDRIARDSDDRLALIRRLESIIAEITAERDRISSDSDERLAVIRRLEARVYDLESKLGEAAAS